MINFRREYGSHAQDVLLHLAVKRELRGYAQSSVRVEGYERIG